MTATPPQQDTDHLNPVDLDALLAATRPQRITRSRMLRRRQWMTVLCLAIVPGTLSLTIGYALYVRGPWYRSSLVGSLSDRLRMNVSLTEVEPLGLRGRSLRGVRVRLPDDGTDVFACARATWKRSENRAEDRVLTLEDGWVLVGASGWSRGEYEHLLTGGLGHRFADMGLSEVRLLDVDVRFETDSMAFQAERAQGVLHFDTDGAGRASVDCDSLNGVTLDRPVNIAARFVPGAHVVPKFEYVRLSVPTIPLSALGIGPIGGSQSTQGTFAGTITYQPLGGVDSVRVSGAIRDADLIEHTRRLPGGPYSGRLALDLEEAIFEAKRLKHLDLSGHVYDTRLRPVIPALVAEGTDAVLSLEIDRLLWSADRLQRFALSGTCADLSLEAITSLIGRGTVTGTAAVDIRSLLIVDDRLRSADVTITAIPPYDGPAIISREILAQAAERWLGVNPAALLPEEIEYVELGVRLTVENDQLRIRGTHGADNRTILTVSLFGRPVGLVRELDYSFTTPDIVGMVRDYVVGIERTDLRELWDQMHKREPSEGE